MSNIKLTELIANSGTSTPQYSGDDENIEIDSPSALGGAELDVHEIIKKAKRIHNDRIDDEIKWFFHVLGLDPFYFRSMDPETIARHITGLYAAKLLNDASADPSPLNLRLVQEKPTGAMYIVPSLPNNRKKNPSESIEYRIEQEYLQEGFYLPKEELCDGGAYRVQVYRTWGTVSEDSDTKLRLFFVQKCNLPEYNQSDKSLNNGKIVLKDIADSRYVHASSEDSQKPLVEALEEAKNRLGPVVRIIEIPSDGKHEEIRMVVAYRHGSTHSFFSGITALYHSYGLHSTRKYIERYANGYCTYSLYLYAGKNAEKKPLIELVKSVAEDLSLIYVLPRTSLSVLFKNGILSAQEVTYSYALWKFAHQFFSCISDDENDGDINLNSNDDESTKLISKVRSDIKREMLTEARVKEVIFNHVDIIKALYSDFESKFNPNNNNEYIDNTKSIYSMIKHTGGADMKILNTMCLFNQYTLKTNFYKPGKVAMSFRLDPGFLKNSPYPRVPYGIFFVVGAEFRGFHIRFVNVARGGIRIIRSGNDAAFAMNVSTIFQENYNLAHTQQRKNKDIPEGGSKGTILLSMEHQDKSFVAFKKYVDALLDLLMPDNHIKDYLKDEELLYLGPDEGTADFMDWASHHAKERSYKFWKAFTTGKARSLGGIPHDYYGMTTRSIHQYVLGILEKQGLDESSITKFQTGGPDGDLGSNEIKISKDKTVGIVDGSGVLFDPEGIDRDEITRLAVNRQMTNHFDTSKLSKLGYYIGINETDRVLPDGSEIESGLIFRNTFHLKGKYLFGTDLFVPCGGRPAAVNASNVRYLWDEKTNSPMFKYIVEGANLFFTQEARLQLEKWGVILFKDASANKGGVTSSSLEVLAALSLNDEEFEEHMQVKDEIAPKFYEDYVKEVHRIIEHHARNEFNCLWREHKSSQIPLSILSDEVSEKINQLNTSIFGSSLWENASLREKVIAEAVPNNLIELVGLEKLLQRVPESYLKAIFGAHLACNFVYNHGLHSGEFGFFEFMQSYIGK